MLRFNPGRRSVAGALVASAMLVTACGSSDDTTSSSSPSTTSTAASASTSAAAAAPKAVSSETIFDKQLATSKDTLPAVTVKLPGGKTVSFKEGEKLKVAYVGFGQGFDYTTPNYDGVKETAKKYGIDVTTFDPAGDPAKQVSQIQDIMSSGKYNAVLAYVIAPGLECDLLSKQLPAKNILVAVHTQNACTGIGTNPTPGVLTTVEDTPAREGYGYYAKYVAAHAAAGSKAIVVTGPKVDLTSQDGVDEIKKAFAGKIDIEAVQYTDYSIEGSQKMAADALQAHPDANLIITTSTEMTTGSVIAVRAAGKKGKVKIYDFGGAKKAIAALEAGDVESIVPEFPFSVAKTMTQALVLARRGVTVPGYVRNAGLGAIPTGEVPIKTKDNGVTWTPEF